MNDIVTIDKVEALRSLSDMVTFRDSSSVRRRMGVNGSKALSIYNTAKWYNFKAAVRNNFRECFPTEIQEIAFIGWYLHIPENGFIDKIATWVNKPTTNVFYYSIALHDNQRIYIDDVLHTYNAGEVCHFCIKSTYEIKKEDPEQLWACMLVVK